MGTIRDKLGVEQGDNNSDKIYKLCNKNQLSEPQRSEFGVHLMAAVVSFIGHFSSSYFILFNFSGILFLFNHKCN